MRPSGRAPHLAGRPSACTPGSRTRPSASWRRCGAPRGAWASTLSVWDHFYSSDLASYECHEAVALHGPASPATRPGCAAAASSTAPGTATRRARQGRRHHRPPLRRAGRDRPRRRLGRGRVRGVRLPVPAARRAARPARRVGGRHPRPAPRRRPPLRRRPRPAHRRPLRAPARPGRAAHLDRRGGRAADRGIVARTADGWNLPFVPPEALAAKRAALARHCDGRGRDPAEIRFGVNVIVCDDEARSRAQFGPRAEVVRPGAVVGTSVDHTVDRSARYVAAGADLVNVALRAPWDPGALERAAAAVARAALTAVDRSPAESRPMSDVRTDELTGATVVMAGSRPGPPQPAGGVVPVLRRRASRPPSPTTCGRSPTAGRRSPTTAARSCSTPPTTTPRSPIWASTAPAGWSTCGPSAPRRSGARDDVAYVLVFENRGPEVGATIAHPHGQIYAYDHVPDAPLAELRRAAGRLPAVPPGDPAIGSSTERRLAGVGARPPAPSRTRSCSRPTPTGPTCPRSTDAAARRARRAARRRARPGSTACSTPRMPYMLWIHQRPTDGGAWPEAAPARSTSLPCMRSPGAQRFVAAGELGQRRVLQPGRPRGRRGRTARSVTWRCTRLGARPGQPDRRPHRLHGRPRAADGDRPRHRDHRRPGRQLGRCSAPTGSRAWPTIAARRGRRPGGRRAALGPLRGRRWSPRCGPTTASWAWCTRRCRSAAACSSTPRSRWPWPLALGADPSDPLDAGAGLPAGRAAGGGVPCGVMDQLASLAGGRGHGAADRLRQLDRRPDPVAGGRRDAWSCTPASTASSAGRPTPSVGPSARPPRRRRAAARRVARDVEASRTRCCGGGPATSSPRTGGSPPSPSALAKDQPPRGRAAGRQPRQPAGRLRGVHPGAGRGWSAAGGAPGVYGARLTGAGFGGCVVAAGPRPVGAATARWVRPLRGGARGSAPWRIASTCARAAWPSGPVTRRC